MNMLLQKDDYEKILRFISLIQEDTHNYQFQVLKALSFLFSFQHSNFFLVDSREEFCCPVGLNVSNRYYQQYNEHYFKTDIFHPRNVGPQFLLTQNCFSVTDLMPRERFEETEFYNDFLKMQNIYTELAMPLKHKNKLLGAIGIFRSQEEGDFTMRERVILEKLAAHISAHLANHVDTAQLIHEKLFATSIISQLPIGLVVLDNNLQVTKSNEIALWYCKEILNGNTCSNPIKAVMDKIFSGAFFSPPNPSSQISISLDCYNFKVIPVLIPNKYWGLKSSYYVYVVKSAPERQNSSGDFSLLYNLTPRETEVVNLVSLGLSNNEIARMLYISANTVRTHLDNIRKKLNVKNRTAIVQKVGCHIKRT